MQLPAERRIQADHPAGDLFGHGPDHGYGIRIVALYAKGNIGPVRVPLHVEALQGIQHSIKPAVLFEDIQMD